MAKELLPDALWLRARAAHPAGSAETEGRATPCVEPGGADRDPVRAEDRYSLGVLACREGLWEPR